MNNYIACVISISQYHIVVSLQDCSTAVVWRYLRSQFSTASLQTATKSAEHSSCLSTRHRLPHYFPVVKFYSLKFEALHHVRFIFGSDRIEDPSRR